MKDLLACCFPKLNLASNIDIQSPQLDHKESLSSGEKMMQFSTKNEINNVKEKIKRTITFEEKDKDLIRNLSSVRSFKKSLDPSLGPSLINLIQLPMSQADRKKSTFKPKDIDKAHSNGDSDWSSNYFNRSHSIDSQLLKSIPDLCLEEIEGNQFQGKKLLITAAGLENSPRMKKDGFVFFGFSKPNVSTIIIYNKKSKATVNDVQLQPNPNFNSDTQDHLFVIYFKKETKAFFLRSFHTQNMSFLLVKLSDNYQLNCNEHILIADLFFKVNIDADSNLVITKMASKKCPEEIEYKYSIDYGTISIGRDKECSLSYPNNKLFSKVHTTFYFDNEHMSWFVADGWDKPSMNGTW